MKTLPLIVLAWRDPRVLPGWDLSQWDLLLRQLRQAGLTASLHAQLQSLDLLEAIPGQPRRHLQWAAQAAAQHRSSVRFEVDAIVNAMQPTGVTVVLLKGAAYVMAQLPNGAGRIFSDIDILVPRQQLDEVESALMLAGWHSTHHDAYDQRYYRQWMHELPPLTHAIRDTVIDVHHAILPLTARLRPDSMRLLQNAAPVPGAVGLQTLGPLDMVLHSAAHLFLNGEFEHGFRDLADLHALLCHFGVRADFWAGLASRAAELELSRPLFYALRYARFFFQTPLPSAVLSQLDDIGPNPVLLTLMDSCFKRALLPHHASCQDFYAGPARFLLYLRGNWLRMPPWLLLRHLFQKAFISRPAPVAGG